MSRSNKKVGGPDPASPEAGELARAQLEEVEEKIVRSLGARAGIPVESSDQTKD